MIPKDNVSLTIPAIEITKPVDDKLYATTGDDHFNYRSPSHSSRMRFTAVKLQVAEPPSASKQEVNDARLRLTRSRNVS